MPLSSSDPLFAPVAEILSVEVLPGRGLSLVRRAPAEPAAHEVEIAPRFSYVSAGTELHAIEEFTAAPAGSAPGRLGYSQCGVVVRVGEKVRGLARGDVVVAIGAGAFHATRTFVAQNLVTRVPDDVAPEAAAMAAMFCFALESVRKSAVTIGDNVVVFGAGVMGQIAARLYHLSGARVCVMDGNATRLGFLPAGVRGLLLDGAGWAALGAWAGPHGVAHANVSFGGDASEVVERLKPHLAVAPDGVPHGRIVFPGGARLSVLMASNMGNIQFVSSAKAGPGYRDPVYEAGADYPAVYVPHPVRRNVETMLMLLREGRLDLAGLVTHRVPLAEAPAAYEMLRRGGTDALGVLLIRSEAG